MNHKSLDYTPEIRNYLLGTSLRKPPFLDELIAVTHEQTDYPIMATDPEQGQFLAFLIKSIGASRIIEIGVFTGVGTLWMAEATGEKGKVVACDLSEAYTSIGRPFWEKAGVAERIDLRLAPALDTLRELEASGETESFDFCYVDADKDSNLLYYEAVLKLLRPGGIIAFDNMLRRGQVADPSYVDKENLVIRELSAKLHHDPRVDVSFLPLCDGVYLARKR